MKREGFALLLLNACESLDKRILDILKNEEVGLDRFWEEGPDLWKKLPITDNVRTRLIQLKNDGWVEAECERCGLLGIKVVTILDDLYPERLREAPWAPLSLYVKGQWPLCGSFVGVVGTRRCSSYAFRVAHSLGAKLARSGVVPVSGGAKGIDGAVHSGAIDSNGPTVAILGTGVDKVYPRGHERLFDNITREGTLLSEYPLGTGASNWRFPKRNRIISAISEKLVVVEAPLKSGAMITARYAMELGREVWAVPGRIDENVARGSNGLIYDGAYPLVEIKYFMDSLSGGQLDFFSDGNFDVNTTGMSDDQVRILSLLSEKGERTVDNIVSECKMSAAEVLNSLGLLLARGDVYPSGPGRWSASLKSKS